MQNTWIYTWLVLLPPVIVLAAAFITKRIVASLFLGILSSALIATNFSVYKTFSIIVGHTFDQFKEIDNYYFFSLIFILGIIISLITRTGGAQALGEIIIKKAKSKKAAETSILLLSTCLFIDDYLNSLTVGYVMRTLTDKFKISRVKLAYLIGTMSGPLVIIAPISSWVGMLIGQLSLGGISLDASTNPTILADSFFVYIKSIPFVLYSIITIASTWFIVRRQISYGPMRHYEKIAQNNNDLLAKPETNKIDINTQDSHSLFDFLVPIVTLITLVIIGIPYSGGYYLFGGQASLIQSFQYSNASLVLFISSIISLTISLIYALIRKKAFISEVPKIIYIGIEMVLSSVITIFLAWIFGAFLKQDLHTGNYLASMLLGTINIALLPLVIYLTSIIIAVAIGSSWGTIAIMVPIVVPMLISFLNLQTPICLENITLLFPCLGAIFSGSITGNHLSPISDSTIMATTSAGTYAIDLIKARVYYVIPSVIATGLSFLIMGLLLNKGLYLALLISILTGILSSFIILLIMQKIYKNKNL